MPAARLLDMAPTLLEIGGYDVPSSMQGKSLLSRAVSDGTSDGGFSDEQEAVVKARLSGLGYI